MYYEPYELYARAGEDRCVLYNLLSDSKNFFTFAKKECKSY